MLAWVQRRSGAGSAAADGRCASSAKSPCARVKRRVRHEPQVRESSRGGEGRGVARVEVESLARRCRPGQCQNTSVRRVDEQRQPPWRCPPAVLERQPSGSRPSRRVADRRGAEARAVAELPLADLLVGARAVLTTTSRARQRRRARCRCRLPISGRAARGGEQRRGQPGRRAGRMQLAPRYCGELTMRAARRPRWRSVARVHRRQGSSAADALAPARSSSGQSTKAMARATGRAQAAARTRAVSARVSMS